MHPIVLFVGVGNFGSSFWKMSRFDDIPVVYSLEVRSDRSKAPIIPYFSRKSPRILTLHWEWKLMLGPATTSIRKVLHDALRPVLGFSYDKYLALFECHLSVTKVSVAEYVTLNKHNFHVAECTVTVSTGVYHGFSLAACSFEGIDKLVEDSPLRDIYDFRNAKVTGVFCCANADSIGGMFRLMFSVPKKISEPLSLDTLLKVLSYSDLDKVSVADQLRLLRAIKREVTKHPITSEEEEGPEKNV